MSRVREIIQSVLQIDPAAPAVEFHGSWSTWGDLARLGDQLETALSERRLGADTRVAVLLRNQAPFMAAILQLMVSQRCLVTLNPVYPDAQVAADITEQAAPVVLLGREDLARPALREAALNLGALVLEVTTGPESAIRAVGELREGAAFRRESPGVAIEMLTSGTTGKPKRVPLKRRQFEESLLGAFAFERGRSPDDAPRLREGVQIATAPLAHISGVLGVIGCVLAGRSTCLIEKFSVPAVHDALLRHRPKVLGLPPAALRMLYDADLPAADLSSVRAFRSGTAPLDPDLADALYERYQIPVLQNYGATEFGGVAGWTLEDFRKHWNARRGAVGRMNADVEARAVDADTFEPLPPGQTGILELRGSRIGDGVNWLRTSDLAAVDEERFLWIKGRADSAIIRGGFKVHPDRVERVLEQHASVREACVVGLPHPRLGQAPGAAYAIRSGARSPSAEELTEFLRARLAPYEVPVLLREIPEFPRTVSLKIDQSAVRDLLSETNAPG